VGHRFDTALSRAQRTLVREAVMVRLAALTRARGLYVRSVLPLPRPLRGEADDEGLGILADLVAGNTPALLVALGRMTYEATGMPAVQFRGSLDLSVYVVSGQARSHEARLAGDATSEARSDADPGIDTVLEHVAELLCGTSLCIPTVYELRPLSEDEVITGADFAVWEQRYALRVQRDIDASRGITRRIREIEAHHQADGAGTANPVAAAITRLESP
jgi:hypothetical protein